MVAGCILTQKPGAKMETPGNHHRPQRTFPHGLIGWEYHGTPAKITGLEVVAASPERRND